MSPEQASGEPVDARSDLYSLGATFFFALSGQPPFDAQTVPALLAKQVAEPAPGLRAVREDVPGRLADLVDGCLAKAPDDRPPSGDAVARTLGEARGREVRAPPMVRGFVRNAEITTMVFIAVTAAGGGFSVSTGGGVSVGLGGPGIVGTILIVQLVLVARRLLRDGYRFEDIRAALLAEAQVQQEEAEAILQKNWLRRLDGFWHRLWAGKFGRWFFRVAGRGIAPPERPALPSAEATEVLLSRAAVTVYDDLTDAERRQIGDAPEVIHGLEHRAAQLREAGETGRPLEDTVAALENVRLALLRLRAGSAQVDDLTAHLDRARAIGADVDVRLAALEEAERAAGGHP